MGIKEELIEKIQSKTLTMGVCGLGYVGLPLAVDKAKHGFKTIGFDVQKEKVDMVNAGKNYIGDVVQADLEEGRFQERLMILESLPVIGIEMESGLKNLLEEKEEKIRAVRILCFQE